jgi:hypothetical protein
MCIGLNDPNSKPIFMLFPQPLPVDRGIIKYVVHFCPKRVIWSAPLGDY